MSAPDALEARLRRLDLRFEAVEPEAHLTDDRVVALAAGAEPSDAEAGHLAACDACLDLLVATGEGLESLAGDPALSVPPPGRAPEGAAPPELPVRTAAPHRGQGRLRLGVVLGGLGLACAAAAAIGGGLFSPAAAPPPAPATASLAADAPAPGKGPHGVDAPPAETRPEPPAPPVVDRPLALGPTAALEPTVVVDPTRTAEPTGAAEPNRPRPVTGREPRSPISAHAAGGVDAPGAVAAPIGEIEERDAEAFGRAPVHAAGRGFGFLRLTATPPAQVFIGDRPYGWTPLFDLRLPEGPHDVRLVYAHPDARTSEERFRVVIPAEARWVVKRKNLREGPPP